MNLDPITSIDRNAAREAFLEYREAFRQHHAELDAELMRGYQAVAAGKQLIRLSETIIQGGFDDLRRPKLAVARANETTVSFERWRGRLTFAPTSRTRASGRRFTMGAPEVEFDKGVWMDTWVARLPLIPPRFRPPANLVNYHLLWEAEWIAPRAAVRAPRDPALLKRIGGDLFAVLAVWDLTDLERAVLEMRS